MWKYIPTLATAFLAVLQLAKDWGAHQTTWRRAVVLSLILCLGVGGAINTYYSDRKAVAQHAADQKQIAGLQKAVETANADQENNTKHFVQSFTGLSRQLSALQSQVDTAGLQKEAARLRTELESTQKALTPPKAELEFSLADDSDTTNFKSATKFVGVKETTAEKHPDGSVSFSVYVFNKSAVTGEKRLGRSTCMY
jgi:hypothetical protein